MPDGILTAGITFTVGPVGDFAGDTAVDTAASERARDLPGG